MLRLGCTESSASPLGRSRRRQNGHNARRTDDAEQTSVARSSPMTQRTPAVGTRSSCSDPRFARPLSTQATVERRTFFLCQGSRSSNNVPWAQLDALLAQFSIEFANSYAGSKKSFWTYFPVTLAFGRFGEDLLLDQSPFERTQHNAFPLIHLYCQRIPKNREMHDSPTESETPQTPN